MLSTLYAVIIFFMTNQIFEVERFLKVILVYILVTTVADGLGLILGSSMDPIVSVYIFSDWNMTQLNNDRLIRLERHFYWCDSKCVQDRVLRILGSQQSHS